MFIARDTLSSDVDSPGGAPSGHPNVVTIDGSPSISTRHGGSSWVSRHPGPSCSAAVCWLEARRNSSSPDVADHDHSMPATCPLVMTSPDAAV